MSKSGDDPKRKIGERCLRVTLSVQDVKALAQVQMVYGPMLAEAGDRNVVESAVRCGLAVFLQDPVIARKFLMWSFLRTHVPRTHVQHHCAADPCVRPYFIPWSDKMTRTTADPALPADEQLDALRAEAAKAAGITYQPAEGGETSNPPSDQDQEKTDAH